MTMELATPSDAFVETTDVLIIGSGAAGLSAALGIVETNPDRCVTIITRAKPADSSTAWAQGGLAAVTSPEDSFASHIEDTMAAGAFHGARDRISELVHQAGEAIKRLVSHGARFDDDLHLEGGHRFRRIVHAGDSSGWEVESTLLRAAAARGIRIIPHTRAVDLLTTADGTVCGARVLHNGQVGRWLADEVVLAAGGSGALWTLTSNPDVATADGLAMALRAGAATRDIEFMQFHPTVLAVPRSGGKDVLISEAVRGEGGILIDERGERFMRSRHPQADLAPRDVVSAEIIARMRATGSEHVYLDARSIADFPQRFPTIHAMLIERGVDATVDLIPVRPGAHYHCGGIAADLDGRTSLSGLSAIGEVAGTGVQGANRLASNSLTEALVAGHRCGIRLAESRRTASTHHPVARTAVAPVGDAAAIRSVMDDYVGVVRNDTDLTTAINILTSLPKASAFNAATLDATNMAWAGLAIARAAQQRSESLGCHRRSDDVAATTTNYHYAGA
ncbi:MAG: L-aspartate oxidase [Corynebacterium casei]|uniref:L-aspartate oxidase n=2 Tax=Corynebacterium casei TaxID=160386 RepID=G7HXV9_9CORY|nr:MULTISPECIES: FAD-binding protein [Corynebacterium]CCE55024.1 L-aspartate oxidase [Corynebacterium casei UCMA 3821]MDN5783254.1 FAD-binding protein [Corynebacterium casei]MDN6694906.1 FAD-binding protein [Corynebacterium casei]MDN6738259.1 FAD-binding protein [Corynebacterium sp.]HCJ70200.1 FAD-binding protein [Corynebacterium casei]